MGIETGPACGLPAAMLGAALPQGPWRAGNYAQLCCNWSSPWQRQSHPRREEDELSAVSLRKKPLFFCLMQEGNLNLITQASLQFHGWESLEKSKNLTGSDTGFKRYRIEKSPSSWFRFFFILRQVAKLIINIILIVIKLIRNHCHKSTFL